MYWWLDQRIINNLSHRCYWWCRNNLHNRCWWRCYPRKWNSHLYWRQTLLRWIPCYHRRRIIRDRQRWWLEHWNCWWWTSYCRWHYRRLGNNWYSYWWYPKCWNYWRRFKYRIRWTRRLNRYRWRKLWYCPWRTWGLNLYQWRRFQYYTRWFRPNLSYWWRTVQHWNLRRITSSYRYCRLKRWRLPLIRIHLRSFLWPPRQEDRLWNYRVRKGYRLKRNCYLRYRWLSLPWQIREGYCLRSSLELGWTWGVIPSFKQ